MRLRKRFILAFLVTAALLWIFNRPSVNYASLIWLDHQAGHHQWLHQECPQCQKIFASLFKVIAPSVVFHDGNDTS
jgi:hypothetical protein